MPSAVRLRESYSAEELRAIARRSKGGSGRDGPGIGGQDRRHGSLDGARLRHRLNVGEAAEFAIIVEVGPDRERVRRRALASGGAQTRYCQRLGVVFHECYVGKLLKRLGSAHLCGALCPRREASAPRSPCPL